MTSTVHTEEAPDRVERRSIVVDAPPAEIFDLLADPSRHREIDGSGTVRDPSTSAPMRLALGSKFGMGMKLGVPYRITNVVVEFDENLLIAWRHIGGHIWRYCLDAVEDGTKVTEEFDWRTSRIPALLKLRRAAQANGTAIDETLRRMQRLFADDSNSESSAG